MTIEQAILKSNQIYLSGWEAQQRELRADPDTARQELRRADEGLRLREYMEELCTHRSGNIRVTRVLDRAVGTCPYCGAYYNAGHYRVRHDDGREVRFDIGLVHFVREGHLISVEDVEIDMLISIMEDA